MTSAEQIRNTLNATAAMDVDESRQTKATEDRSDTGDGRSRLGASKAPAAFVPNFTSFGCATPTAHQSYCAAGVAGLTPTRLFGTSSVAQKAATSSMQDLLRSAGKMSIIVGQDTDSISQLSAGVPSLAGVSKKELKGELLEINEMLEKVGGTFLIFYV